MRFIAKAAIALALLGCVPAIAQTPAEKKAQENSADEAAVRGTFEAAQDPDNQAKRRDSNQKLEDAAGAAQQRSNPTAGENVGGPPSR
jgi:hypothetical protein